MENEKRHDGKILHELLEHRGRGAVSRLSTALNISRQMIYSYYEDERFTPTTRAKIIEGLKKLDIDPSPLQDIRKTVPPPEELNTLVLAVPKEYLPAVRRMLVAEDGFKNALLALIDMRLTHK